MTNHRATAEAPSALSPEGTPSPAEDGLAAELAAAAPRRWWNRGTVALAALLLAGCAFLGGAYTQQHYGQQATAQEPSRGSGFGNRSGQFPGGYSQGAGSQPG